ncbi:MAG TPA: type II secretion system protein [Terriglobales bacterium]|nr:type II secretion system protein [Terriglobales bacterium]
MKKSRAQAGFSMIEAVVVIAIALIMGAVALFQIGPSLKSAKSNTALQTTLGLLRRYHDSAVDQRRIYRVTFIAPRTIQVDQVGFDTNGTMVFTFVSSTDLPQETQFLIVPGVPTGSGQTPDGLGSAQNAIDFSLDYGGGGNTVFFQKDGRSTDVAGRLNSGVVYVAQPGDLSSSKAVTVLGATGRVKGWRLFSSGGKSDWRSL